jgi:hypothetical protein
MFGGSSCKKSEKSLEGRLSLADVRNPLILLPLGKNLLL